VVEDRKHPALLAVHLDVQRRSNEPAATHAEPAADDLEPVGGRPLDALHLECDARGNALCVISDRSHVREIDTQVIVEANPRRDLTCE
jgi:hypothetical protein